MTMSQANKWAHIGNGEGVYMDFTKIILPSNLTALRFQKPDFVYQGYPGIWVRFDGHDFVNPNQGLVYGIIDIILVDKNTVWAKPNDYDFDIKGQKGSFVRDLATMLGGAVSDFGWSQRGVPFTVYFMGYQTIPER